ncbi:MAG: hypothetical protein K8R77_06090 [Anaerolineaceae bacterium]|nr:hypothetical protein [Anaerolineaceae bacterium]
MKQEFEVAKTHVALTDLARTVHVMNDQSKADALAELEAGLSESEIRWAYFCAGIPNETIDNLLIQANAKAAA